MARFIPPRDILSAIAAGAEAVDRGERDLAQEVRLLAEAGLLAAPAGPEDGTGAWPAAGAPCWLFETLRLLGEVSLPLARLYEGHVDALGLVWRFGGDEARSLAGETARSGGLLAVWGADAAGDPVNATVASDGTARLDGCKAFASGLGVVEHAVVSARRGGACRLFLVPADDRQRHDADAWDMDGMVGSASGQFRLEGLRIAPEHALGGDDAFFGEPWFHGGLWRLCAAQAGALHGLAIGLRDLLAERGHLEDPQQRARLSHVALAARAAHLWAEDARAAFAGATEPGAEETALFAREAIERAATESLCEVERAAGTAVHRRSSALGRQMRDLRLYLRQAAPDRKLGNALRLWLARADGFGPGRADTRTPGPRVSLSALRSGGPFARPWRDPWRTDA